MTLRLDEASRARLRAIKAEERALKKPLREARRLAKQEEKANRPLAQKAPRHFPSTKEGAPRRDKPFMGWIHTQALGCIACALEGPPRPDQIQGLPNPIEAAHQWTIRGPMKGLKTDDDTCLPLCRWHHQLAPNACDKGQKNFWIRLGLLDVLPDLCRDLYAAFKARQSGQPVIDRYTQRRAA